jgi:hypothetical protein
LFKQGCRLRICFVLSFKFNSLEAKGNVTKWWFQSLNFTFLRLLFFFLHEIQSTNSSLQGIFSFVLSTKMESLRATIDSWFFYYAYESRGRTFYS